MNMPVELRALLADPSQAGAWFVELHDRAALVETGNLLGFAVVCIDMKGCSDQADALQRIAMALKFPDWFGGNWDALGDCLADLSWWPAPGYLLLLDHVDNWRAHAIDDCDVVIDIINEVAARHAAQQVALWGLMPLPGTALAAITA